MCWVGINAITTVQSTKGYRLMCAWNRQSFKYKFGSIIEWIMPKSCWLLQTGKTFCQTITWCLPWISKWNILWTEFNGILMLTIVKWLCWFESEHDRIFELFYWDICNAKWNICARPSIHACWSNIMNSLRHRNDSTFIFNVDIFTMLQKPANMLFLQISKIHASFWKSILWIPEQAM